MASEKISKFIGNNLEKVSENKLYIKPQVLTEPYESSNETPINGSPVKRVFLLFVVIIFIIIIWKYIHKYFPEWKTKISQMYDNIANKIYNIFHKPPLPPPPPPKPKVKDLLTKAQMNNFHSSEKETSEPQPITKNESYIEPEMFNKSNNLNSNEILDYLLKKENNVQEWCFVGESNGVRHCTISEGNKCISGNVFPTKDLCINPKLRS